MPNALVLDDDDAVRRAVVEIVEQSGFTPLEAADLAAARAIIEARPLDLALLDLQLPDGSGLELLEPLDELPRVDVIVISGEATVDLTAKAFRSGVVDVMTKPVDPRRLREALAKALSGASLAEQVRTLRGELRRLGRFGRMVGVSPRMQEVYDLIAKVAPTESAVMILGETGTGKELVAATIRELGKRASRPYVPVNCGAIQPDLIESELFGHEKGAFTGADRRRRGLFERASGGTIFLDEVTEMPAELQVKLLRVLESGEFSRVGGDELLHADVRIVAASNRDLQQAVDEGALREDLMYRLLVFPIRLPPLRERGDDVVLLAESFLDELNAEHGASKRIPPAAMARLAEREWPGNVRELKHAVQRAFVLADDELLSFDGSSAPADRKRPHGTTIEIEVGRSIAEAEKALILATLEAVEGNKKRASKMLGISVKTLYARLARYGERG